MKKRNIMLFLVLALLIGGCTQFPTGEVVEEPGPIGVEEIVKETLPVQPEEEPWFTRLKRPFERLVLR